MGIDYNADLVYGIKIIDDKLVQGLNEDELELDRDLDQVWSGSAYSGAEMTVIVCIKKSRINMRLYDDPTIISQKKLIAPTEWHDRLAKWAKENDCSKSQIGWWLCVSEI